MSTYMITEKSRNNKTGPIMTVISESSTCPDACPLKEKGCYAKYGRTGLHWRRHDETGTKGLNMLIEAITGQAGKLWRFNVAGDLPGVGNEIDAVTLLEIVQANREAGAKGFTYTHKPMDAYNAHVVALSNRMGFTVNLSANDLTNADELADLEIAPVVTLLPADQLTNTVTPKGRKVVVCPAVVRDDVTCATCGLCQRQRDAIVGFPAHGAASKTVSEIASS